MKSKAETGLLVGVLRGQDDCTNGGVSAKRNEFVLLGEGVSGPFTADAETPALRLVRRTISGKAYLHAEPVNVPRGKVGPMFGGNFCYTTDSRFPSQQPIPIHDRFETEEEAELTVDGMMLCRDGYEQIKAVAGAVFVEVR